MTNDVLNFLGDLVREARARGADEADAVDIDSRSLEATVRFGKIEHMERSELRKTGLRVLVGRRQAVVASADRQRETASALVERAVAMARAAPEDPHAGLAEPALLASDWPELDLYDADVPASEEFVRKAAEAEAAALDVAGVTNSEGAGAGRSETHVALVSSNGFAGGYRRSGFGLSVSVLAGEGTAMESEYDWSQAVHASDLADPAALGLSAGERAVRRLGPVKPETAVMPVVFEQRLAGRLVGALAGAINGAAVARGTSFLKDAMGEAVLRDNMALIDDPGRRRGLGSRPFDAEGLPCERRALVENGVLRSWLLDLRSARQLGVPPTGNAARSAGSAPGPTSSNLYLEPGGLSPEELIGEIESGLFVTSLMGHGVDLVAGRYSQGAGGFAIRGGKLAEPVSEITIAGDLRDMLLGLDAADDLVFRGSVNAPTLRVDAMTVGGR